MFYSSEYGTYLERHAYAITFPADQLRPVLLLWTHADGSFLIMNNRDGPSDCNEIMAEQAEQAGNHNASTCAACMDHRDILMANASICAVREQTAIHWEALL